MFNSVKHENNIHCKAYKNSHNEKMLVNFLKGIGYFSLSFFLPLNFSQKLCLRNFLIILKLIWAVLKHW